MILMFVYQVSVLTNIISSTSHVAGVLPANHMMSAVKKSTLYKRSFVVLCLLCEFLPRDAL